MLAITISWIAISVVFLSFGDFFVFLYNRLCKRKEEYGIVDTFLLGMCFTLIPLSVSSFWFPSNQYILFIYLLFSIVYWVIRRIHVADRLKQLKLSFQNFSILQIIAIIIPVLAIMAAILWQVGVFDSLFYHQQNIRWNEEFAVVPGLGNLEHRFAFNSNYFLLSAVFSFRFLFGEAIYGFHVLILVYVLCWIVKEIFVSGYEVKRLALLIIFMGYIFTFGYSLASTSTDAIPNIISFYLIAKLLLYPGSLKKNLLFYVSLPVALITFKVSVLPLCLISLVAIYYFIRSKQYRPIITVSSLSALIVLLWLGRNVIISGYLIFPFTSIDLFAVDWKIPKVVAVEEKDFILSCGIRLLDDMVNQLTVFGHSIDNMKNWFTSFLFIGSAVISPFIVLFAYLKKKYLDKTVYVVYATLVLVFIVWYIGGPDPRFIGGSLFGMVFFVIYILFSGRKEKYFRLAGIAIVGTFTVIMAAWPVTRTDRFTKMFGLSDHREGTRPVEDILIRPYPYRELLRSAGIYKDDFHVYRMSKDVTVYISESPEVINGRYVCFDSPFPCTILTAGAGIKYLDVSEIEPRGDSLQNGFRIKRSN